MTYSLGLLLAEMNNYAEAARISWSGRRWDALLFAGTLNQALALLKLGRWEDGERALLQALEVDLQNRQYFATLIDLYLRTNQKERAGLLAEKILVSSS